MLYPYECAVCGARDYELWSVDLRNHPTFCRRCGWRMQRLPARPSYVIGCKYAHREDVRMFPTGTSQKDILEFQRESDEREARSWQPNYDAQDEAIGGTPL